MSVGDRAVAGAMHPLPPAVPRRRARIWKREAPYVAALSPAALILGLFFLTPAIWAIYTSTTSLALTDVGATQPHFIGLDNYRRLGNDPDFPKIVTNTVIFVVGSAVIGQSGLGLALALLIDHARHRGYRLAANLAFAAVLLAWIAPPVLTGFIWGGIYAYRHGTLNALLGAVGLGPVDMLGQAPMFSVILADIWRGTAFAMLIFLGALQTIPSQVYEAARVDGASAWARFWDHTLPTLRHVATLVLLMTTIVTLGSFLLILVMTNGDPGYQTETIALYAYHRAFSQFEIGFGASISVVMLTLNLVFAGVYLRLARVRA